MGPENVIASLSPAAWANTSGSAREHENKIRYSDAVFCLVAYAAVASLTRERESERETTTSRNKADSYMTRHVAY